MRRGRLSMLGQDESVFIEPLQHIVQSGKTAADDMLAAYETRWAGSVLPVFKDYAF